MSTDLDTDSACVSVLSTSEIVGIAFIAESGVISTVAVLIFAALVIRNYVYNRRHPGPSGPAPLFRTHVDGYMVSLMFADLLQGIGAITSAKWAANGRVTCSSYCTAQGAIQQLGESGVAMTTLVITLHTFATVFFRWQPSRRPWLWMVVVALIWTFLFTFVLVGYLVHRGQERSVGGQPYFGPTPFWCWIGPAYMIERIAGEYFWLWFCAFINILVYPLLFVTLRGNVEVDPGNWRRIRFHRRSKDGPFGNLPSPNTHPGSAAYVHTSSKVPDTESVKMNKVRNKEAMKMFWYPISYTFLVLPLSINRWLTFRHKTAGLAVAKMSIVPTSIVLFIFGLSGVCNVLLFLLTRPNLLLFGVRRDSKRMEKAGGQIASAVSFANNYTPNTGTAQRNLHHRRRTWEDDMDAEQPDDWEDYDDVSRSQPPSQYTAREAYSPAPPLLPPPPPPRHFDVMAFPMTSSEKLATAYRDVNVDMRVSRDSGVEMVESQRTRSTLSPTGSSHLPVWDPLNFSSTTPIPHNSPPLAPLEPVYGPSSRMPPVSPNPSLAGHGSRPDTGERKEGDPPV